MPRGRRCCGTRWPRSRCSSSSTGWRGRSRSTGAGTAGRCPPAASGGGVCGRLQDAGHARVDQAPRSRGGLGAPRDLLRLRGAVHRHRRARHQHGRDGAVLRLALLRRVVLPRLLAGPRRARGRAARRAAVHDAPPRRRQAAAAALRAAGPIAPTTPPRSGACTGWATGSSSARCSTSSLTGYLLEGVRIAMDSPGQRRLLAGRLARVAARGLERRVARRCWAPCATSSGGRTASSPSRSSPRSRTRRPRTCSRATQRSCSGPAGGQAPASP